MKWQLSFFLALLFVASPAWAGWWPFGSDGLDYRIEIEGADAQMQTWFHTLKLDKKTEEHPPQNSDELEQEGMRLENRLSEALKAKGYYEAQIEERLDAQAKPPVLHYTLTPGAQARLSGIRLEWQDGALSAPALETLSQKPGDAVDAAKIDADAAALQSAIGKDACLLSLSVTPVLHLNPDTHEAELVYRIAHGARANFGAVAIEGNTRTHPEAIERLLTWKRGECFDQDKIAKSQAALFASQLFSSVKITPAAQPDAAGEAPVTITLSERSPRTLSAGANYATDQGYGVKFGWEHRNLDGGGEKLDANAVLAQQEQSLTLTERTPGFKRDDQTLILSGSIAHNDTDAYASHALGVSTGVERKFAPSLNGGASLGYNLERTDDAIEGPQTYSLVSLPLFAEYDKRDNAQDATKGIYARLSTTPYQDMLDPSLQFLKTTLTGQAYASADMLYKPTLALRASLGSILGSTYRDLPADLRYYAGGGGSVRGYTYQSLSPRENGSPIGGGSLVELSGELRLRFTDTIGMVTFVDAGNAYAGSTPDFGDKLYVGAGLGARYYSSVGPIRLDVGFPLNGSDIGQTGYAIYASLGQAF